MKLVKHGSNYGSWSLPENAINENSIVYSFGVGEDISFDVAIMNRYNPFIYLFDPTPRAKTFFDKIKNLSESNDSYYDEVQDYNYILNEMLFDKTSFNNYGLSNVCKNVKMYFPTNEAHVSLSEFEKGKSNEGIFLDLKDLKTVMSENNHDKIDVLKMDIEGSEFDVIDFILENSIDVKHLLIEFHDIGKDIYAYYSKLSELYTLSYINNNDFGFIKK